MGSNNSGERLPFGNARPSTNSLIEQTPEQISAEAQRLGPLLPYLGDDGNCAPEFAEYRETFKRDGFVIVPGLLSKDEVDHYREAVSRGLNARKESYVGQDKTVYETQFTQCLNLWEDNPSVAELTFHPSVTRCAASLLGVEQLRIWHDQALFKPAGGKETTLHFDHPFWPIDEMPQGGSGTITAWMVLSPEGSRMENGCLGYLPGSHKSGLRIFPDIVNGDPNDHAARDAKMLAMPELAALGGARSMRFVEVPAGSVAFHHGLTVHNSTANSTALERKTHCGIYVADGVKRGGVLGLGKQNHPMTDRRGAKVEHGAPLQGAVFPVAFPRPKAAAGGVILPESPPPLSQQAFEAARGSLPGPRSERSRL